MYRIVSEHPIIVAAIIDVSESGPCVLKRSVKKASEALPDNGLKIASGTTSVGRFIAFVIGEIKRVKNESTPELWKTEIAANSPIRLGIISNEIEMPSFAPLINESNILIFLKSP